MSNFSLHSMMQSIWVVPQDDQLESALYILEEEEKKEKEFLQSIAETPAPDPIGTNVTGIRLMSPNRSRTMRVSRHRMSSGGRNSYGYTPTSAGTASRMRSYMSRSGEYSPQTDTSQIRASSGVESPIQSLESMSRGVESGSDDNDSGMEV